MPRRTASEREQLARAIADRMDGPLTVLGILFLLVVLVDTVVAPTGVIATVFDVAGWLLWLVFVAEFVVRAMVAPSTAAFLRRNWWQLAFLALPFLRFLRLLARFRIGRLARVVSSAVRSGRTAAKTLSSRLAWLSAVTAIVVLAASQLLYESCAVASYGEALHRAALATIAGEPIGSERLVAQLLEVVLALYSVVVFAALAGMLGAFFLERRPPGGGPTGE